jgi:hypothetical protein
MNFDDALSTNVKKAHSEFHLAAADVVRRADSGESVSQEVTVGGASHYSKCSDKVWPPFAVCDNSPFAGNDVGIAAPIGTPEFNERGQDRQPSQFQPLPTETLVSQLQ